MRRIVAVVAACVVGWGTAVVAHADTAPDVYGTPGVHLVNGRFWNTSCAKYSSNVVRCTTQIYATQVVSVKGRWFKQNTWVFNNLSYLPSERQQWAGNPLAQTGTWVAADGRTWRTECDTPTTGRGACRNYVVATVASERGGVVTQKSTEVFNSMLRFSSSTVTPVTSIPAPAPARTDVPKPGPLLPLTPSKPGPVVAPPSGSVAGSGYDCPASHPIKGNASSMIYHVRGQQYYSRTKPEECFAKESDARAAGYRKSKV